MRTLVACLLLASPAMAEIPQIAGAEAQRAGSGWRIGVTLAHPDTGWDHYADGWRVELADGTVLGTRELAHPHVNEQPFTRSLGGVVIPDGVSELHIRARCNIDGWGSETYTLPLR